MPHKTGYVYLEKIYDNYKGKTDIERDMKAIENKQKNILDTLKFEIIDLDAKSRSLKAGGYKQVVERLQIKKADYERLVKEFSKYNSEESQKQVSELLKQINQFIKDYGDKNDYDFIFGAVGNGSLMYAKEKNDLTEDVSKYVNQRYEGK